MVDPGGVDSPKEMNGLVMADFEEGKKVFKEFLGQICELIEVVFQILEDFPSDLSVDHFKVNLQNCGVVTELMMDIALGLRQLLVILAHNYLL